MIVKIISVFTGGKCPFGQIPLLEVDGVTLCQSMAILRFLARRYGMHQFFLISILIKRSIQMGGGMRLKTSAQ